jgi:hypothetical protein
LNKKIIGTFFNLSSVQLLFSGYLDRGSEKEVLKGPFTKDVRLTPPGGRVGKTGQNLTLGRGRGCWCLRYSDVRKRKKYFSLFLSFFHKGVRSAPRMIKALQQSTQLRLICTRFPLCSFNFLLVCLWGTCVSMCLCVCLSMCLFGC